MPVPTAERQRHAAGTRFDQPPGQEELVHPVRAGVFAKGRGGTATAVAIAEFRVFAVEVEGFGQLARSEDLEGGIGEGIEPLRGCLPLGPATEAVVAGEQHAAVAQAVESDAVQPHFGHLGTVGQETACGPSPGNPDRPGWSRAGARS